MLKTGSSKYSDVGLELKIEKGIRGSMSSTNLNAFGKVKHLVIENLQEFIYLKKQQMCVMKTISLIYL
jgi:hypothetical protein